MTEDSSPGPWRWSDHRFAIGDANTQSRELGAEHAFGAAAPGDRPEGVRPERLEQSRARRGLAVAVRRVRGRPVDASEATAWTRADIAYTRVSGDTPTIQRSPLSVRPRRNSAQTP